MLIANYIMPSDYFYKRATVRNFKKEDISDELIKEIISAAMHSPTCGNMQLYTIIITREKHNHQKLSELHYSQPAASTSDVILTICADFNRFTKWCEISNAAPGYNNFHSFLNAFTDALIITQQIVTIAEQEGIGTCYLGTVLYNADKISELLKLPDLVIPVASLGLGWKNENPEISERLNLEAILHSEYYHNGSDEEIKEWFDKKFENPANKKFIIENNKNNLAQVFTDIRYPRKINEDLSILYLDLLKKKNFMK